MKRLWLAILALGALFVFLPVDVWHKDGRNDDAGSSGVKLYWFIPDGLRADPDVFTIYEWAAHGELPNIKKMMDRGSYGYSVPVFPGHTPTNFATLLTGAGPKVHGVSDGPMRFEHYPLKVVSKSGFSSHAKRVPPIWYTLESKGRSVALLSVPGSTPPELSKGITIKGRWGGWGMDFPAANFHAATDTATRLEQGIDNRLFGQGVALTHYLDTSGPSGWSEPPPSYSEPREVTFTNWGTTVFALIYDSTDDGIVNYDGVLFSKDKKTRWADLKTGSWSEWLPITLSYETSNDYNLYTPKKASWELGLTKIEVSTQVKIKVIRLGERDFFRIRFYYNALNRFLAKPSEIADDMVSAIGPMVDFVDNFPPQLIYYPEDKTTFLEEARMSLDWHRDAARYLINSTDADVIIHDIYTPNQFLTSRWWMKYLDPSSARYGEIDATERDRLWAEAKSIYKGIDSIIGEVLDNVGDDTYVVLSSDHGILPLETKVNLNNLFAREGLLSYTIDPVTGYYSIDWEKTRAIFLKMDNVYINPKGLGGNYERASGADYLKLREQVIHLLEGLQDERGLHPLARATVWEDAEFIDLPKDRVGDIVIANRAGFGWSEEISDEQNVFEPALSSGYKQAVIPDAEKGMWTPFVIMGPGVKRGYALSAPIRHIDQYPTIMTLLGEDVPEFVEGRPILELFR